MARTRKAATTASKKTPKKTTKKAGKKASKKAGKKAARKAGDSDAPAKKTSKKASKKAGKKASKKAAKKASKKAGKKASKKAAKKATKKASKKAAKKATKKASKKAAKKASKKAGKKASKKISKKIAKKIAKKAAKKAGRRGRGRDNETLELVPPDADELAESDPSTDDDDDDDGDDGDGGDDDDDDESTQAESLRPPLSPGEEAPPFSLQSDDDESVSLADLHGQRFVLYFYPKDATPGCTKQACDFRDNLERLRAEGVSVFGVSGDSLASHRRFREKQGLNFPLLSDPGLVVTRAYGAYGEKVLYGRKSMGVVRSTFVIGPDGRVEQAFSPVRVPGHVDAVLRAIASTSAA